MSASRPDPSRERLPALAVPTSAAPAGAAFGGRNQAGVGVYNRGAVLRAMLDYGRLSRTDLHRLTGLAPSAVTGIVRELVEHALLREVGTDAEGTGDRAGTGDRVATGDRLGRKQTYLELDPTGAHAVAVHLGVRNVLVALIDLQGRVLASEAAAIRPGLAADAVIQEAVVLARRLVAARASARARCVGVGVATTGPWNPAATADRPDGGLPWEHAPIEQAFRDAFGVPCAVENNIRAMALGEAWFGRGRESDNLVLLYLGNVLGCGIIINRQVFSGSQSEAGQLGHVVVDRAGRPCSCGARGCLETVASRWAIAAAGRDAALAGAAPVLLAVAGGDPAAIADATVLAAAAQGDAAASRIVDAVAGSLALVIWNLARLVNPASIVLAGLETPGRSLILERVTRALADEYAATPRTVPPVLETSLGDDLNLVGAATLALERFFSAPVLDRAADRVAAPA